MPRLYNAFMTVGIREHVALITGASRGIGAECAFALASEGAKLMLSARTDRALTPIANRCLQLGATGVLCHAADLCKDEAPQQVVARCIAEWQGLDILVNNAGVWHPGMSPSADLELWNEQLMVNLQAAMRLTRLALPHVIDGTQQKRRGAVIFISSMSGLRAYPGGAGYCASKFGVVGFARAVFDDVAPLGIKVSAICPGWVNTDMAAGSGINPAEMIQPAEVAELVRMVATWPNTSCPCIIELEPQMPLSPGV